MAKENFIGKNYNPKLDVTEIAKLIKKDIKKYFPNIKVSVKSERYSGGKSINVIIKQLPFNPFRQEYIQNYDRWSTYRLELENKNPELTTQGKLLQYNTNYLELEQNLYQIINSYNYDKSNDTIDYFNVNFYGDVRIDRDSELKYLGKR